MPFLADFHTHFASRSCSNVYAAGSRLKGTPQERVERVTRSLGVDLPRPTRASTRALAGRARAPWRDPRGQLRERARGARRCCSRSGRAPRAGSPSSPSSIRARPRRPRSSRRCSSRAACAARCSFPAMQRWRLDGPKRPPCSRSSRPMARPRSCTAACCASRCAIRFGLPRELRTSPREPRLALIGPADRFPALPFVIPQFGAGFLRETLMAGAPVRNVYVDRAPRIPWLATRAERSRSSPTCSERRAGGLRCGAHPVRHGFLALPARLAARPPARAAAKPWAPAACARRIARGSGLNAAQLLRLRA